MPAMYIIEQDNPYPHSYCEDQAAADLKLAELIFEDPAKWQGARVMTCDEWFAEMESGYLARPIEEVTAERYHEMLNCLPPLDWRHAGGVERFNMLEFQSGKITSQFAQMDGRYFHRYVRHRDESTYMTRDMIQAAMPGIIPPACD